MEMHEVNSSHFAAVGYDPDGRKMHIRFQNGSTYEYGGVPEHDYRQLLNAKSAGIHFHRHVKKAFQGKQIS